MRLRTTSIADADVAEAAVWLNRREPGLGNGFVEAVDKTFDLITNAPLACPTYVSPDCEFKSELRSKVVVGFSHRIIFLVQSDEVSVVAVLHPSRDVDSILRDRVGEL